MATTVWRSTRSIGRPMPRSATSDSVATSSARVTGREESEATVSLSTTRSGERRNRLAGGAQLC